MTAHLTPDALAAGLDHIRQSPVDNGRLELIVCRPAVDERLVLEEGRLDLATGLIGDMWSVRSSTSTPDGSPDPNGQVTIMNAAAIALVAGLPERWPLAGDQLYVDLDLSEAAMRHGHSAGHRRRRRRDHGEDASRAAPSSRPGSVQRHSGSSNTGPGRVLNLRGRNARVVTARGHPAAATRYVVSSAGLKRTGAPPPPDVSAWSNAPGPRVGAGIEAGGLPRRAGTRPARRCPGQRRCRPASGTAGIPAALEVLSPRRLGFGLRLEASETGSPDVVALLVVGVLSEGLAVLGRHLATLGRLLDRQADAPALQVDLDDLDPQLLARADHLLGQIHVVVGHFGDVHQPLDALAHLHEGPEGHQLGDPPVDQLADPVGVGELLPGVGLAWP